jgi:hypothetical protein
MRVAGDANGAAAQVLVRGPSLGCSPEAKGSTHSPEMKFMNGDYLDRGRTERRHIQVSGIIRIGNEANRWEEQLFTGIDKNAQIEYGEGVNLTSLDYRVHEMCEKYGERHSATRLAISRETLRKMLRKGCRSLSLSTRKRIRANVSSEFPGKNNAAFRT